MFLAGQEARVSAVHVDLDGETHVAVSLVDDPAAEPHDWYGRSRQPGSRPTRGETVVRMVGVLTTLLVAAGLAGAVVVGVRSVPDVKRYLAMRRM